jgi:predicted transcriptional regulator of viral defense system
MSIFIHNDPMRTKSMTTPLKKLGIFTAAEAIELGYSQPSISRLAKSGELVRLEQGIFRHRDAKPDFESLDYVVATKRFGDSSAIGLLSALTYHGLIEQVVEQIWILVPPNTKTNSDRYRCIRVKTDLNVGIERHKNFAITNIERTIIEAFKYSSKIGLDVAVRAARFALKKKLTTASRILKQAKELKMERFIVRHWEAITID